MVNGKEKHIRLSHSLEFCMDAMVEDDCMEMLYHIPRHSRDFGSRQDDYLESVENCES